MSDQPEKVTFPATLEAISGFTQQLEQRLEMLSLDLRTTIVLALHELLVNIAQHAYGDVAGDITCQLEHTTSQLAVTISDHAEQAFTPPDSLPEPDPLALPESGLGLFIMHQTFDNVTYERLPEGNRWYLVKHLGEPHE